MNNSDFDTFIGEFRRLSSALERYKVSQEDFNRKADAYFHVLKPYPITDVIAKADRWLAKESKFPTPAQWAGVIVPQRATTVGQLTDAEARAYRQAELAKWDGEPCPCDLCKAAGVDHRFLRFVPDVDADDQPRTGLNPFTGKVVTRGHWAHGVELARYYQARQAFFDLAHTKGWTSTVKSLRGGGR